jgi:O-antigen ligase
VAIVLALPTVLYLLKKKVWILPVLVLVFLGLLASPNLAKRFSLTFSSGIEFIQKKFDNRKTLLPIALAQVGQPPVLPQGYDPSATKSAGEPVTAKTEKPVPGEPADLLERIVFRSGGIRFNVEWPRAIRAFLKNPVLGTGYSSITLATDNDYLRALGETGGLGFLSFLLIFLEVARRIVAFLRGKTEGWSKAVVVGMAGVIIAMAVNALFIDVFEASKIAIIFWLLMGILIATIRISQKENV